MSWEDRIVINPRVLAGKPVIAGTRISVELILDLLAAGWTWDALLASYPQLSDDDLRAAVSYAASVLKNESVHAIEV